MDCEQDVQIEITLQIRKCSHGVYIPLGTLGEESPHCGLCNVDLYNDIIILKTMARRKPVERHYPEERTLDAASFMEQSAGARMASTREFFTLGDTL